MLNVSFANQAVMQGALGAFAWAQALRVERPLQGVQIQLDLNASGYAVIGRSRQADLQILQGGSSQVVSGRHAAIFFQKGSYWLRDLWSKNRTYCNGEPLEPGSWRRLRSGDEIGLGSRKSGEILRIHLPLLSQDLASFAKLRSLVGTIPGLTPALERAFLRGDTVLAWRGGGFMMIYRLSGAETTISKPVPEEIHRIYLAWRERIGFSDADQASGNFWAAQRLIDFGRTLGLRIDIESAVSPLQAEYLESVLRLLPEGFFNNGYLRALVLGADRSDASQQGSFLDGEVHLFEGSLRGPRRNLLGLLLHEMGHSTGERYDLHPQGDRRIPLEIRESMSKAYRILARAKQVYAVDWMGGLEARRSRTSESFDEFIAEMHTHYVADGEGLRRHIEGLENAACRWAYEFVYAELRDRIFWGREY